MTTPMILDVKLNVSAEVLDNLQNTAETRQVAVDEIISEVLTDQFGEPSKAEILETMRQSLREGLAGKVRPVDDVLAELKAELNANAS